VSALRAPFANSSSLEFLGLPPGGPSFLFSNERNTGQPKPWDVGMQMHVSILHHDYPAPVRDTVESKLQHLVKFYDRIISMRALLEKQHDEHRVELVANVGNGAVLVVDARDFTFPTALEDAIGRMERLLKRHHDKLSQGRRRGR
jgi:ribosomal subunit interface protein